jgi:hypothetical protein
MSSSRPVIPNQVQKTSEGIGSTLICASRSHEFTSTARCGTLLTRLFNLSLELVCNRSCDVQLRLRGFSWVTGGIPQFEETTHLLISIEPRMVPCDELAHNALQLRPARHAFAAKDCTGSFVADAVPVVVVTTNLVRDPT